MLRKFPKEEVRSLAKAERDMDDGTVKFVMLDGRREAVTIEAIEEFQLVSGQTVTHIISHAIVYFEIDSWLAKKAISDAQKKMD